MASTSSSLPPQSTSQAAMLWLEGAVRTHLQEDYVEVDSENNAPSSLLAQVGRASGRNREWAEKSNLKADAVVVAHYSDRLGGPLRI